MTKLNCQQRHLKVFASSLVRIKAAMLMQALWQNEIGDNDKYPCHF